MTISKLADVQEELRYAHEVLPMLGDPGKRWTLGLWKKVELNNDQLTGRNRKAYWAYEKYGQSAGGPFSEATPAFASANAEDAAELEMSPVDMQRTIGLSWQRLQQLRQMEGKQKRLTLAKLINDALNAEKGKIEAMFEGGRGDNIVARAFESTSGATFKCAPQVPILCQRGDELTGYKVSSGETNDERLRAQADTGTSHVGATNVRVLRVTLDGDTPQITFTASATWYDDCLLAWAGNPTLDAPNGLPVYLDNVSEGTFKWDSEDGTSSDHADTYYGATRSSNPDAECWVHNCQTADLDIPLFSTAMAKCLDGNQGDPSVMNELVVFMNPRMWRRFVKTSLGAVRLTTSKLFLPGNSGEQMTVPTLTGKGVQDMPIRLTYRIPDGFVSFVHYTKLRKVQTDPTWIPGNDGIWHLLPQASVAGYQAQFEAYLAYSIQGGLFLPPSSGVLYNLSTAESV